MKAPDGTDYAVHGAGPTVVLIHGLGLTRATWDGMIPALAARFRIVAYDLIGHGASALPAGPPDLAMFARQIRDLMDHLGLGRAALVGFSLGGMINRRFALDFPGSVAALGILNSPHDRGPRAQRDVEDRARDTAAGGAAATIEATLARWFTPGFRADHPEVVDRVRRGVLANDPQAYAACRWVLANGVVELIRPDPPVAVPALVMTCEQDTGSTPAMSQAIAAEIAGAETIIVPGLRHMGLVERPDLFSGPIIDFLERLNGGRGWD